MNPFVITDVIQKFELGIKVFVTHPFNFVAQFDVCVFAELVESVQEVRF